MRRPPCRPAAHLWRRAATRGGGHREVCEHCGTQFPCASLLGEPCGHIDCHAVRGLPLPDGVTLDPACTCPPDEILQPHRDACPRASRAAS